MGTASGNITEIQFNSAGNLAGDANLVWAQGGLFVGGKNTTTPATGFVTARNELRIGPWRDYIVEKENTTYVRLRGVRVSNPSPSVSGTYYGFTNDRAHPNNNLNLVLTNEGECFVTAMVLGKAAVYNTAAPKTPAAIFGVSVSASPSGKHSTGQEPAWRKMIEVNNWGELGVGGNISINPSWHITQPSNNSLGIVFADGTFQYTAAVTTIQNKGGAVISSANPTINFTGAGVTTSNVGGVATVNIPGGGGGASGAAAGSNTQVQFNRNNAFGASPNLTFDETTGTLSVGDWQSAWGDQVLGKATGNLNVRGRILVGTNPATDDTYGTIRMLGTNRAYGFTSESSGMFAFTNEEATYHQAMVLADTRKGYDGTIFGISSKPDASEPTYGQETRWEVAMDVRGNDFLVPVIAQALPTGNILYFNTVNGRVSYAAAPGGAIKVKDEGTLITPNATEFNFVGTGVTSTSTLSGAVTVTIPSTAVAVADEGTQLTATASRLNFVGTGVTANASAGNVTITIPGGGGSAAGNITELQYNNGNGSFGANASLRFNNGGLFVGGVANPTANATGIISATNEFRVGNWQYAGGVYTDRWGRIRVGQDSRVKTAPYYGFVADPNVNPITGIPARTLVITNEELEYKQAMVLMDGKAYPTANTVGNIDNVEGTIFGVSGIEVSYGNSTQPSTGTETGWRKLIDVTNTGNTKIGGSLVISPSFQPTHPGNANVGIYFADGTFQYTAAGLSGIAVKDEGNTVSATANVINFVGTGVTATQASANNVTVTINSASLITQDEGANIATATTKFNFVGSGVTATGVGNSDVTVTIPGNSVKVYDAAGAVITNNLKELRLNAALVSTGNTPDNGVVTVAAPSGGTGGMPVAVSNKGTLLTSAVTGINFLGTGVSAAITSGNNISVTVPGFSGITAQDEGTIVSSSALQFNFVGAGVTATGSGSNVTVTIPGASSTLVTQDEGSTVVSGTGTINFVGTGVTASNVGGVATVTVPALVTQDEGSTVVAVTDTMNFVGTGVTASNVGNVATVTVNALITQDEGSTIVPATGTINFVGAGVTASDVGGVATVTVPALVTQDEGYDVVTVTDKINFVGSGVTATNIGGVATVTIPGRPALNIRDEGSLIATEAFSIDFVGSGVTATSVGNAVTVNIPGGDTLYDAGYGSGALTFNRNNGTIQKFMLTGNIDSITITNIAPAQSFTIILKQTGGARTLTAPGFKFASGYKILSTVSGVEDMLNIFFDGSTYYTTLTTGYVS